MDREAPQVGSVRPLVRARLALALGLGPLMALPFPAFAAASSYREERIDARDDFFEPEIVRVHVGTDVEWANDGRNPHTVTADDGSFDSSNLEPGATFSRTFEEPGVFAYFCRYHGAVGGIGMAGVIVVGEVSLPSGGGTQVGPGREPEPTTLGSTLRVPAEYPTIQAAVDAAHPGDMVLVSPGVYREAVKVVTPYVTIRGTDRNTVILEGEFRLANGIHVIEADGVAVENMTARHYQLNGFYWTGVFGYRGSYLTAYNDGDYGIYAFDSVFGRFEHSYASGHPDSGFYIGQCYPCHAVITDIVAQGNALGYSGTNAGGDLIIATSVWHDNMAGIVPNTLDTELLPPQREVTITGNVVYDNNNLDAPAKTAQYPSIGTGILLAGGVGNVVEGNRVFGHLNYGIAVFPNLDRNFWFPVRNEVRDNVVRGSGRADLVLAGPAGEGNCFAGNEFDSSLPPAIQTFYGCGVKLNSLGGGDLSAAIQTLALYIRAQSGKYPQGDWRTAPEPPPQENMPDAGTAPPAPAVPQKAVPGTVAGSPPEMPPDVNEGSEEVTVLGVSIVAAPTWWSLLLATYAYLLPLILYVAWICIALWDIIRRDELADRRRIGWMAVVLLVPLLGPILYYVLGRSPIPRSLRLMLVAGGFGTYVLVAVLAVVVGSA